MDKNTIDVITIIFMLIWSYGGDEIINWKLLFERIKIGNKKPITVWLCYDETKKVFQHNHFEEGHLCNNFPTPLFPIQKSWLNKKWKYYYAWINRKNIIIKKS